ncbi:hypothetical protein VNI00_015069 [Paramarasmius palmivorus]|uniref:Uncharacterized protein n=1 Tax=Paramarasmius palmivorus TaxID=297713 RepID=A0AAW0BPS7_9AGAR
MKFGFTSLLALIAAATGAVADSPIGDPNYGILSPSGDEVVEHHRSIADYINVYLVSGLDEGFPGPHAFISGVQLITELKPNLDENYPAYYAEIDWAPWSQILPNNRIYQLWVEEKYNAGHPSTHPLGARTDVSYWQKSFLLKPF